VPRAFQASRTGDLELGLAASIRAREIAERFGDRDLAAMALSCERLSRLHKGEVERGLAMIDEATVAAVGGEIEACSPTSSTRRVLGKLSATTHGAPSSVGTIRRSEPRSPNTG
jgi:hypothetical protein